MTDHPDIAEMQQRYERISASPSAVLTDGLVLLAGLWLAISPWVVHFNRSQPDITASNLILGIAVAVIGFGLTAAPRRMLRVSWAATLVGVWVIVSQWVILRATAPASIIVTNVITGAVIALLGIAGAGLVLAVNRRRMARR